MFQSILGSWIEVRERAWERVVVRYVVPVLLSCMVAVPAGAVPEFGILQFKVEHTLETAACLTSGTCTLSFEEFDDTAAWLAEIRANSDLAVFHWDRGIPWLTFDVDPPTGIDRVAFYESQLDPPTLAWIDAFAIHFEAMGRGYLSVSILSGERNRLAALHLGLEDQQDFPTSCPSFAPGTQVSVDLGSGPISFDLERSYRNFLLYLATKLTPDYLAIMVEANSIEKDCPTRADGLYALYRSVHDDLEAEIGQEVLLFATLAYLPLLEYERQTCFPTSSFVPCGTPPGAPASNAGAEQCYPTNSSAIDALNLGGRLDLLALSFYPDSLEMNPVPDERAETSAYSLSDWDAGSQCTATLYWADPLDPMAALDRLGWTGPVAIAETSARSCVSPLRFDLVAPGDMTPAPMVFELAGSPASQAAWVSQTYQAAIDRGFIFYLHSFLRDYPPVGPWTVEQGVLPLEVQQLFNIWPCSGLQDANGQWKPEMAAIGLPEPAPGTSVGVAVVFAALLAVGRRHVARIRGSGA